MKTIHQRPGIAVVLSESLLHSEGAAFPRVNSERNLLPNRCLISFSMKQKEKIKCLHYRAQRQYSQGSISMCFSCDTAHYLL
jgi:hypothetical protein